MTTNNSKLLEKVLSKYRVWDIAYAEFEGHSKEKREGTNQFVVSINAVNEMEAEARADEREKAIVKAAEKAGKLAFIPATKDEIINLLKQPNSQLTMTTKTLQEMLKDEGNKARADTAKQIFKELDAIAWEQIEPSRLEEFYEQFSNAKDLKASLNVATAFSIIGLDAEKYEALKKKYNIEE